MPDHRPSAGDRVKWIGLIAGPIVALAMLMLLPVSGEPGGLSQAGRATAAVASLMAVWWLTEALPLPATSLLPIALLPLLGVMGVKQAAAPYAHELIYLFMGGFVLGLGMERWGLHKRIALITILAVGTRPRQVIAGFMIATALMSMWVSNTATTIMMLPIGASVIALVDRDQQTRDTNFGTALMLGIAYAASIGGIGTLIGTPPNLVLASFARDQLGIEISMVRWMIVGLPLVAVFLPVAWLYLTRIAHPIRLREIPGGRAAIISQLRALGPMSRGEQTVFIVFMCAAACWIFRAVIVDALGLRDAQGSDLLTDTGIAVIAALALFVIPVEPRSLTFVMDWETARRLPWGILLLFGGGLSLAAAIRSSGLDHVIGGQVAALGGLHPVVLAFTVTAGVIFLTELTSNTAVTNTLMPVLTAAAVSLGVAPMELLLPAALAASCAFMLPVATPPNAIVFSSGHVTVAQMMRAGLWLNLAGIVVVTLVARVLGGSLTTGGGA